MTPSEAIAAQQQRPRLPARWGQSLSQPPHRPGISRSHERPVTTRNNGAADRLLTILERMGRNGDRVRHWGALADPAAIMSTNPTASVMAAFATLRSRGEIDTVTNGDGTRTYIIRRSGVTVRTE